MNKITIQRIKKGQQVNKVLSSKKHTGGQLLDRYLTLIDKLNIVIDKDTLIF